MRPPSWPDDFVRETLYDPSAWCVHEVLDIDPERRTVDAVMHTEKLLMLDLQKELPGHPKHVPAAMAIQASGTMGQLYAVYALGLRASEGWVGFGTHITKARFGKLGVIGPPVHLHAECTRVRTMFGTTFCEFAFTFTQEGGVFYKSEQTAAWKKGA